MAPQALFEAAGGAYLMLLRLRTGWLVRPAGNERLLKK